MNNFRLLSRKYFASSLTKIRASGVITGFRKLATEPVPHQIVIAPSCNEHLKKICQNGEFLRISVEGGGCSGFQYMFDLDSETDENDRVFGSDDVKIIVDTDSLEYISGATIEYHEELIRSGFRIIDNPIAQQGCSCGASFSIKM